MYVAHLVVRSVDGEFYQAKRRRIYRELAGLIHRHQPIDLGVVEEQTAVQQAKRQGGENSFANMKTIVMQGVMLGCFMSFGVPVIEVAPKRAKIALLGKGNGSADKKTVQRGISGVLGVELPQDAADGGALAITGLQMPEWEVRELANGTAPKKRPPRARAARARPA